MIKWRWAPVALLWYLLTSILWVKGWLLGFVLGSWHAWRGNFRESPLPDEYGDASWEWDSAFMRRWFQTRDNQALPMWYRDYVKAAGKDWGIRRTLWDFCVMRNGFGGNPWNMRNFPGDEIVYKADAPTPRRLTERFVNARRGLALAIASEYDPSLTYDAEPTWYWLHTQSKTQPWKMGVWWLRKLKPTKEKPYRHFEIRHGFKFYPDREMSDARFSVWDTGVRS